MARGQSKTNPPRLRKRVEAETVSTLKRARDGSAFTRCGACNKDVAVGLIDMHSCSLDSKIRMTLESQIVEKAVESNNPPEKKRTASSEVKEKKAKKGKKSKDPSAPKRPPTAFFLFMDDFRKSYKEANPDNKSVAVVAKEGGEKWKSMSEEEKKPYAERAAELKAVYDKAVEKNNQEDDDEAVAEANQQNGEVVEETNREDDEEREEAKESSSKEEEEIEDED